MYFFMIGDLLFTFFNYRESEELNPFFREMLYGNGQEWFIYAKLGMNTAAAYAIIYIRKYRRNLSIVLTIIGIAVYATVFYFHVEIYQINHGHDPIIAGLKQMLLSTEEAAGDVMHDMGLSL
jgi:hypothetical protein